MSRSPIDSFQEPGRTLFRRCVECPSGIPSCPSCAKDQTCQLVSQSCDACAKTICIKNSGASSSGKHSAPAGAIAGGVIGGLILICALTYLFWRFCIRNRRRQWEEQAWSDQQSEHESVEKRSQLGMHPEHRQSTRSVHSVASTVLTRASNVIQIAYIPGVTNRSPPDTPGLLVPPVPPLPLATVSSSASSTPNYEHDQHFFMPGDLRDSTFSGYTDTTRNSISPSLARSSVATTIYRNNAVVDPIPAQQLRAGKAVIIRTKSGSTTPNAPTTPLPSSSAPSVPQVLQPSEPGTLAASKSPFVGRTMVPRPIEVRKTPSGNSVPTMKNLQQVKAANRSGNSSKRSSGASHSRAQQISSSVSEMSSDDDADRHSRSRQSLMGKRPAHQSGVTMIEDSPNVKQDGFGQKKRGSSSSVSPEIPLWLPGNDGSVGPSHRHKRSNGSLNQLIEDAMNRARDSSYHGLQSVPEDQKKDGGPFSDVNEVKENQH